MILLAIVPIMSVAILVSYLLVRSVLGRSFYLVSI